jgi:regulatory protein
MGRTREPKNPKTCHERALGLLAVRPRSRHEMEVRLLRAGFDQGEVDDVLGRLERARLLDDEQFARDLAQQAFDVRRSGQRAVASALFAKGVSRETVEEVTAGYADGDPARALELAEARAVRMADLDPSKAYRRLTELLMRRGHSPSVARQAAGRALGRDESTPS